MLNVNETYETKYCIPDWERDEQIKINVQKTQGRFAATDLLQDNPVAVVAFGPSLKETWQEVKKFKNIITCSGAHKFLLEHGLKPEDFENWWHAEVDPRPHKIELLGPPQPGIKYLPCSAVHPTYLDHLLNAGAPVGLWHSFVTQEEAQRVLPAGEWATCGGQDIGQRSLVLARMMGFRQLHCFGFDGCFDAAGSHAAEHPKWKEKQGAPCEYPPGSNTFYNTTPSMLMCAQRLPYELDNLKDVEAVFYGDGLTQAVVRDHKKKEMGHSDIAFAKPMTFSEPHRKLQQERHASDPLYGTTGEKAATSVLAMCKSLKTTSVLDYGCGKGRLGATLTFPIWEYDPGIPGKDASARPADIVVASYVLDHVEPEYIDAVLNDLRRCVLKVGLIFVATDKNDAKWWAAKLAEYFEVGKAEANSKEALFVVGVKKVDKPSAKVVEYKGTKFAYLTPNEACVQRAKTILTKEPTTVQWIESFEPGEIMWDVGACIGGYTVLAGRHRGVTCYAFEPSADNYALLAKNMRLNNIAGAAYPCALTDAPVVASSIYLSQDAPGSSCNSFGSAIGHTLQPRAGIPQGSLGLSGDKLIELGVPAPHHVKIDVDGLEHAVVAGMAGLLAAGTTRSLLIEVNPALPEHQAMLKQLADFGYDYSPGQATAARRAKGAFKGIGEIVFRKLPPILEVEAKVLDKIKAAPVIQEPFPHLYLEDVFPEDFYGFMMQTMPRDGYQSLEKARGTPGYPERSVAPAPDCVKWLRSGRLRKALDEKFGVESANDETALLRDVPGYHIGPHTDTPKKGVTALFYMPRQWTDAEHGTSLYVPKEPGFKSLDGKHHKRDLFDVAWTAPGKPNSVLIFARTDNSFHGCEPYSGTQQRDILLYDTRRVG